MFRETEAVLLSTCNRVEVYAAGEAAAAAHRRAGGRLPGPLPQARSGRSCCRTCTITSAETAVRHLFTVAASLDSMVVGEPQILAQVKQAYQAAVEHDNAGPLLHAAFQAAIRVARRVATETAIHQRRVSIPSVAVADFARQIFERFDDKQTLVIGAGEMAEETLRYLRDEGARRITVVNRHFERAERVGRGSGSGRARPWEELPERPRRRRPGDQHHGGRRADRHAGRLIGGSRRRGGSGRCSCSTWPCRATSTRPSASGPTSTSTRSTTCRPPASGTGQQRDKELPAALRIIDQETEPLHGRPLSPRHRPGDPATQGGLAEAEGRGIAAAAGQAAGAWTTAAREEVRRSFDRLLNKLLHPPLESLRDESRHGIPHVLLDALARLFQLKD